MCSQIIELDDDNDFQDDPLMFMQDSDDNDIYFQTNDAKFDFQSFLFDGLNPYKMQEKLKEEGDSNIISQNDQAKIQQNLISFSEFCKFIHDSIDPHHAYFITCHMLMMLEKAFIEEFGSNWKKLSRNDKRKKERILQKLYENSDIVVDCIRNYPDKYLRYVNEIIVKKYSKK